MTLVTKIKSGSRHLRTATILLNRCAIRVVCGSSICGLLKPIQQPMRASQPFITRLFQSLAFYWFRTEARQVSPSGRKSLNYVKDEVILPHKVMFARSRKDQRSWCVFTVARSATHNLVPFSPDGRHLFVSCESGNAFLGDVLSFCE